MEEVRMRYGNEEEEQLDAVNFEFKANGKACNVMYVSCCKESQIVLKSLKLEMVDSIGFQGNQIPVYINDKDLFIHLDDYKHANNALSKFILTMFPAKQVVCFPCIPKVWYVGKSNESNVALLVSSASEKKNTIIAPNLLIGIAASILFHSEINKIDCVAHVILSSPVPCVDDVMEIDRIMNLNQGYATYSRLLPSSQLYM